MSKDEAFEKSYDLLVRIVKADGVSVMAGLALVSAKRDRDYVWFARQIGDFIDMFRELKEALEDGGLNQGPILEVLAKYLNRVSKEEAMKTKDAIDRWFDEYYPESVSEDLDEAAKRYATEGDEISGECIIQEEVAAFKAGAQWKYQQMIKDAVESRVTITSKGVLLEDLRIEDFDYEDKVKLITINED